VIPQLPQRLVQRTAGLSGQHDIVERTGWRYCVYNASPAAAC
jgi:hypothetical protein